MEMIQRNTNKYILDFKKTLPYFIQHIKCGKTLSKKTIEKTTFQKGDFFTILPDTAVLDQLYEFSSGGIIPPIPTNEVYHIESYPNGFRPNQVITTVHELTSFVFSYLAHSTNKIAVVEDYMAGPDSSHLDVDNVQKLLFDKEVYYLMNSKTKMENIYKVITTTQEIWHFLTVLSVNVEDLSKNLIDGDFDKICNNANFIIISAYDGEGYIFWERS